MKKYLIATIIFSFIFSPVFLFSFQKVGAADLEVPVAEKVLAAKEAGKTISIWGHKIPLPFTSWDSLAWLAANIVIRRMVDKTVEWINNGFKGPGGSKAPFFVTNPGDFLKDAGNEASGLFLAKLKLTRLCSNWAPMIQVSLQPHEKPFKDRMECTFDRVVGNYNAFMNDFSSGGWAGWLSINQSNNNPYGVYLQASSELAGAVQEATNQAQTKASWGKGFLSQEVCNGKDEELYNNCIKENGNPKNCTEMACTHKEIQTPGTTIENRLADALGSDVKRLISADEFDEIFGALFNQLIQQGIKAVGSVVGGGGNNNNTFSGQGAPQEAAYLEGSRTNAIDMIDGSIANEQSYLDAKKSSLDSVNQIIGELKSCSETDSRISGYESRIAPLNEAIQDSKDLISRAEEYKSRILSATTYEGLSSVLDDYDANMQPLMHTAQDVQAAQNEDEALKSELEAITKEDCVPTP